MERQNAIIINVSVTRQITTTISIISNFDESWATNQLVIVLDKTNSALIIQLSMIPLLLSNKTHWNCLF